VGVGEPDSSFGPWLFVHAAHRQQRYQGQSLGGYRRTCSKNTGGSSLLKQPRGDSAISRSSVAVCEKLVRLKPGEASAHIMLGNAYAEVGRTQEAAICYREALSLTRTLSRPIWGSAKSSSTRALTPSGRNVPEGLKIRRARRMGICRWDWLCPTPAV